MKRRSLVLAGLLPLLVHAQLVLPGRLQLTGSDGAERQVTGLADPAQGDGAVSLDAARSGVLNTTTTIGSVVLEGQLVPAPTAILPGMLITIIPTGSNADGASLALNGYGPYPLVKWGGVPVDSADLPIGVPNRLIFDGARYHVLHVGSRPCPAGSRPGGALFCIEDSTSAEGSIQSSMIACEARGGRLCSYAEWTSACRRLPQFLSTVSVFEWVDDAANNSADGKVVGSGYSGPEAVPGNACEFGSTVQPQTIQRFRCCYTR